MQVTVISFEEVMQTKLKVKLCISQSSRQSLYITKETCSSSTSFSLSLDLSLDFVAYVSNL